jgi:predicted short-subunit dehydrogenase-like oxidoreductase (DUF2520 family)
LLEQAVSNVYYQRMLKSRRASRRRTLGFIGLGRVGGALLLNCLKAGEDVAGVYDVNQALVRRWVSRTGIKGYGSAVTLAQDAEVIFLTVPDREIGKVYRQIRDKVKPGSLLVHCAGSIGTEIFTPAGKRQLETLALHPIQTFLSPEQAVRDLPGSYFALAGTKAGLQFGRRLVKKLRGRVIMVRNQDRVLYHCMCVFVSNFMNALFSAAEEIGLRLGFSPKRTRKLVLPLALTTLRNIINQGARAGLTGPARRGDRQTIERHIRALKMELPELVPLYRVLNRRLMELVKAANRRSSR